MSAKPSVRRITPSRKIVVDGGRWMTRRHAMHGLVEWDVTQARQRIAAYETTRGVRISFSGWLIRCIAQAVSEDIDAQAIRDWRGRLVTFPGVDVVAMVESRDERGHVPVGHVVRNAAAKSVFEITREIRMAQRRGLTSETGRLLRTVGRLPAFVRWIIFAVIRRSPRLFVRLGGTVAVTSVGMFGGVRWGVAPIHHTIGVTVGSIELRDDRELLAVTLGVDHDVLDGGPAARLAARCRELVESAAGLPVSGAAEIAAQSDVGASVGDDVRARLIS